MSDHFSGPRALAIPQCDIGDLYAFPSPERAGQLVLVMDVWPKATATSFFSDSIVCRFRLHPVTIGTGAAAKSFVVGNKEILFECRFDTPGHAGEGGMVQEGTCTAPNGERLAFRVHDPEGARGPGLRLFAGLRSDPFFLDYEAMKATLKEGRLMFRNPGVPSQALAGANILSVVLEIDSATWLWNGSGPLFAVVGETVTTGSLPIRLERVGRPEVKNILLAAKNHDPLNRDIDLRDLYNIEDAYHLGPDYRNAYHARMHANLAYLDSLDGKIDWPLDAEGAHPLTELMLADFLVVDVSQPFAEDSFLEIEQAMLEGRAHRTCGGRSLNDDVMDTLYSLLIAGGKGARLSDHVDQATVPAGNVFPYLAPPNSPTMQAGEGARGGGAGAAHPQPQPFRRYQL